MYNEQVYKKENNQEAVLTGSIIFIKEIISKDEMKEVVLKLKDDKTAGYNIYQNWLIIAGLCTTIKVLFVTY